MKRKTLLVTSTLLTVFYASQVLAADEGKWLVRGRVLDVIPVESGDISPIGGNAKISNDVVPEIDVSYFFSPNIAVELIAATSKHDVTAKSTSLGDVNAGDVWLLPPTLTLQYHFTQLKSIKPYVGAGINYTHFYNADSGDLNNAKYSDSVGPALQVGVDIPIKDHWYFNFDVKKLWIKTDAKFNDGTIRSNVDINPWVVGTGIGYRF